MNTRNIFTPVAYKSVTIKWMIMRWTRYIMVACIALLSFAANAQEKENSFKKAASEKALVYTAKMMKTLDLSKEQAAQVYRLRYELSISLQLIHLQYSDNEKLLIQFAADAQKDFQTGVKKVLKPAQIALLNQYKKDFVATQHKTTNSNPVETLPQTAAFEW